MADGTLLKRLLNQRLAPRIFQRDASVFADPSAASAHASVRNRLGWVGAPTEMIGHLADVEAFATEALAERLTDVYLLGMGGSSLCAEVLRDVPLARHDLVRLVVLDTTDERTIRAVTAGLSPKRSLFIVASKSGSTIEVAALERHFWSVMTEAVADLAGRHFVAITDPDTELEERAESNGYRRTFINPADIGGRFSALSLFGLVPAALLGLDLRTLVGSGGRMAGRCRDNDALNPGLSLGAFLADCAELGRDKLTLLLPPSLAPLGSWIEQLVAESTGKDGHGILPVVGESVGDPSDYGPDRVFVAMLTQDAADARAAAAALEASGRPVFRIETSASELGGEFFRWEFATAVAGAALGVNPFDEPNVRDAKQRTQRQLDARKATGAFRLDPPLEPGQGFSRREHRPVSRTGAPRAGRYLALLDYLPAEPRQAPVIDRLRGKLRELTRMPTTYGVGPRYLHSTGQYHKGGPNSGVFVLMTSTDATETPVPGTDYSFSTLKQAQALGDFEALVAAGRHVVHFHVEDPTTDLSAEVEKVALGLG